MDFDRKYMEAHGSGRYERLDAAALLSPGRLGGGTLHVLLGNAPGDSGAVHADVRARWMAGDLATRAAMDAVADCARQGRWGAACMCAHGDVGRHRARGCGWEGTDCLQGC
eukprot:230114-Chlamydomonas_euryale.AAC.2